MPPELQRRVHEEVEQARRRSGWPAKRTLAALGVPGRTYYRWLREEAWARALPAEPVKPVQPFEALAEEKETVLKYARKHPELRQRELAWRMVDEDVACLSALDGVPHPQGSEPGVPVAEAVEASAGGGGKGDAAEAAVGNGPNAVAGRGRVLLLRELPG